MSRNQPADLVNVDFWADRIAAVIKLAEHYGMTVEITGGELVVSRQVSEAFTASAEVRWQAAPPAAVPVQPAADDTREDCECGGSIPHPDCPVHAPKEA